MLGFGHGEQFQYFWTTKATTTIGSSPSQVPISVVASLLIPKLVFDMVEQGPPFTFARQVAPFNGRVSPNSTSGWEWNARSYQSINRACRLSLMRMCVLAVRCEMTCSAADESQLTRVNLELGSASFVLHRQQQESGCGP